MSSEAQLRTRLGIPPEAPAAMIFAQNSHLDPDWQMTFDDYYRVFVKDIFVEACDLLAAQPRAFYSISEMCYLKHHLAVHPEELPLFQSAAGRGALRIVGGGMTSPDTLLPETELLIRDFLYGTRFAADVLGARPRAAWLPDDFGHAATAPDLLSSAGFEAVAFGRVDGAPNFLEIIFGRTYLLPGSTAELLADLGSADFLWRGPGGGEVLAHYMSHRLYCSGDDIDYIDIMQIPGGHVGVFRGGDPKFTDARIDEYAEALRPYARTPYLFVPVGCDFQFPKKDLLAYLDGYNERRYPETGLWAAAGTFEDYADLVQLHRDALPVLQIDITPYFMGFYGTRADLKRRTREAARPFFSAEPFAVAAGDAGRAALEAAEPWFELLTRSNHHDFITGTSTDPVVTTEQMPLLDQAETGGKSMLQAVTSAIARRIPITPNAVGRIVAFNPAAVERTEVAEVDLPLDLSPGTPAGGGLEGRSGDRAVTTETVGPVTAAPSTTRIRILLDGMAPLSWRAVDLFSAGGAGGVQPQAGDTVSLAVLDAEGRPADGSTAARVVLSNDRVRAELNRGSRGFALTSLRIDDVETLSGPSFVLADYADMGGLWRLGNEMKGCSFTSLEPPSEEPEAVTVLEHSDLTAHVALVGSNATREIRLDSASPGLDLALITGAAEGTTRTAIFAFAAEAKAPLRTSLPAGFAERVPERLYKPTFWPAVAWASVGDVAVLLRQSTGVHFASNGVMELMAARDARNEKCTIQVVHGSDPGQHRIDWRIQLASTPAGAARAALAWNRPVVVFPAPADQAPSPDLALEQALLDVEGDGIVTALKPAERGDGFILHALLLPGPVTVRLGTTLAASHHLVRVDAVERDIEPMGEAGDTIRLDRTRFGGSLATVRLR